MVPSGELHISSVDYRSDMHCTENPIYVFPEMKLPGLVTYSDIHVSVSDLCITRCSAQTQTRMGCLRKSPEVEPIPAVD
jgi:hypothetical protein